VRVGPLRVVRAGRVFVPENIYEICPPSRCPFSIDGQTGKSYRDLIEEKIDVW